VQTTRGNDMKSLNRVGKSVSIISIATFVSITSMAALAEKSEPQFYTGTATLCALIAPWNSTTVTKGKHGITYEYDLVLLFRIETDSPIVTGWEILSSNTKAPEKDKAKGGYSWGEAVLTPDLGTGTLVDEFRFPVVQGDSIRGTYHGNGDYAGITVEYALSAFTGGLPVCDAEEVSAVCDEAALGCVTGLPPGIGYYISGVIME
jgi:hypothetical protein